MTRSSRARARSSFVRICFALVALATAAAAQEPLFVFAQMSDSQPQTDADNQAFVDVLRTLSEAGQPGALLPRPVDLLLFAGDITWGNTRPEWEAATQKLDTWLTANGIPFLAVPGNHDVNNSDTALYEEFIASSDVWNAGSAAFTGFNGHSRTTFWEGLRFIGINNSNPGWNTVSSSDLAVVMGLVAAAEDAQENVFLLCHHPHNEKDRVPLADVLPSPVSVGYLHGHSGSPNVRRGLTGIVNPVIYEVNTNATYDDRGFVYFYVYQTELRAHVVVLNDNPTSLPAPTVIPLVHPLRLASEQSKGFAGAVHTTARATPTSKAPEHKLWFHDGTWWGILWSDSAAAYRIQRLNTGTQTWTDTGPTVSTNAARSFDVLSQGSVLIVASNVPTQPATAGNGSPGDVSRFTYDFGQNRYVLESGYPAAVNDSRSPTLVVVRDTTGKLWTAWTRDGGVRVNHSTTDDRSWAIPITGDTGLGPADTVALAASNGVVGAFWSNSAAGTIRFAYHVDGDPDETWTFETVTTQAALVGSSIDYTTEGGRALAAVRASDGSVNLFERAVGGGWTVHPIADAAANLRDPLLVVDDNLGLLRVFATGNTPGGLSTSGGGAVYVKAAPLDTLVFPPGRGTVVIQDGQKPSAGFATSARAKVDATSGLAVLGSVAQTERYWHAYDPLTALLVAPVAEFSGTPLSGPAPLAVDFTDLSTGSPTYWEWSFGDGMFGSEQNPRHVYTEAGLYTVTLRAANGGGESTRTRTAYVEVTAPPPMHTYTPVADARVSEGSPTSNSGSDSTVRVRSEIGGSYQSFLRFDLGVLSGTVSSVKLRLFCTDSSPAGGAVFAIEDDTWGEGTINWSNKPALPATPLVTLGGVTAGFWTEIELGPGAVSNGLVSFALAGGSSNSALYSSREGTNPPQLSVTFIGSGSPPVARFNGTPTSGEAPLSVSFTDASTEFPSTWVWDFGDGTGSTVRNPTHVYTQPGLYTVILDVSNANGLDTMTRFEYVEVLEPPPPPPTDSHPPIADAHVYERSPTRNYGTNSGLRVKAKLGTSYQSFLRFDLSSVSGGVVSAKLRLFCTDGSTDGGSVYLGPGGWTESGLTWATKPAFPQTAIAALGSVVTSTWVEVDVTGAVGGAGIVEFVLAGGNSNSATYSSREGASPPELVVETGTPSPPTAAFSADPLTGGAPLLVSFSDESSGATSWLWDFGDGQTSTERHPAHLFQAQGTYSVSLLVTNSVGSDSEVKANLVTVTEAPPTRKFLPVADARANEGSPTSKAGSDAAVRVREALGGSYHTYLRFDLSTLTGNVVSAKLRLFSTDGSDVAGLVFPTSGAWTEADLCWENKPGASGPLITSTGTVATNAWAEFDVTAAVGGAGTLNLVLQSTSSNSCYYSSREGANPPELVITTAAP